MRIRLEKKGYISENEYGGSRSKGDYTNPATATNKRLILKNFQTPLSTKTSMNFKSKLENDKEEGNNAVSIDPSLNGLSLQDCLSTQKRVKNMTLDYKGSCAGAHPSYATGYNPRHYNYLKNSGKYTNHNKLNTAKQPNLMLETNEQTQRLRVTQMIQYKYNPTRNRNQNSLTTCVSKRKIATTTRNKYGSCRN